MMVMTMNDDYSDDINTATESDLNECYGSTYFSAVDLGNKKIRTRIAKVLKEKMRQTTGTERPKLVVYFTSLDKPMVLNATNKNTLVEALGRDPAKWKGAEVGLFTVPTQFGGKSVKGLRLHVLAEPKKQPPPTPAAAPAEPPPDEAGDPGPWFAGLNEAAE
jgi:hypothetical protein